MGNDVKKQQFREVKGRDEDEERMFSSRYQAGDVSRVSVLWALASSRVHRLL